MIVVDTSALVSIASIDLLDTVLTTFDVNTTRTVVDELEDTAEYDDRHGDAACSVLMRREELTVHQPDGDPVQSSRIDPGEGSCARLTGEIDAAFLITDDLRALPELQTVADADVAISPIVLRALVNKGVLSREEAMEKLDRLAVQRDWLGAPIYRRAERLLE